VVLTVNRGGVEWSPGKKLAVCPKEPKTSSGKRLQDILVTEIRQIIS
jgi:hypothetical protein